MSTRPSMAQLPMSPPVPQPAPHDISDVLSRYLPSTNQQPVPNATSNILPGLAEVSTPTATSAPVERSSSSFVGHTPSQHLQPSPYNRVEQEALKDEAELVAERAISHITKPLLVETPDSRLYQRGMAAASSEASIPRYSQAGVNVRSPNTAEFRVRYADPTPDDTLTALRLRVREVEELEEKYSNDVDLFRKQAEFDKMEKSGLVANMHKLRTQVVLVEEAKGHVEAEKQVALARRDEDCNRKILNMRKSLLLSEQTLGSLRTVNEELASKAAALDVQREECEALRRQIFTQNQNMTLLAQQNEQLQRALKRKEGDTQADLDVYVKQLDLVQAQAAAMKKEMDVMTIKLRAQETLEEEVALLRQQNLDLQGAINEVDKEAAELQEKHTMAIQEKDDECAREVLNFRRQILTLEKQIETLTLQNQHLLNKHRPQLITDEINQLNAQLQALTDELEQKTRQNEAFQRAIVRKEEERNQDVADLEGQLEAARTRINEAAGEFRAAQLSKAALESEIALLKSRSDDLRVERDKIEGEMLSRCRELQCQVDVLEHRANTNMNEADTMRALTAAMEEKHRAATELLNAKHQSELREALKRKDDNYADIIADHVKQLEISSRLTASVRTDNSSLSQELAKASSDLVQIDALKARVVALETQLAHKEEEAAADLQTFNSQADGLTRELNQIRSERDEARAELFAAQQQVEELRRIADTVPELEAELEETRGKVIAMNSEAIRTQKAYAAHVDELQNQIGVFERQLNENLKASSATRELEYAVKQRQLTAENEKLRDIIKQHLGGSPSPSRNTPASPPTSYAADPLPELGMSQSLRARAGSPSGVVGVSEEGSNNKVPRVPPLELSKATGGNLASPLQGTVNSQFGSLYDSVSEAVPVAQRSESEEAIDPLLYGHPITYGNQMRFDPIPRLFEQAATLMGDTVAIRSEKRAGEWEEMTWRQYYLKSFNFAKALVAEEIQPFHGVVLCAANAPEWMSAFCGSIFAGALPVACHPGWGPRHCFRIASECNAHIIVVDSGKSLQKFLALKDQLPSVKHIVVFREAVPPALKSMHGDFILNFEQFLARANHATDDSVALRGDNVLVEHAATILYTSGTLGEPKGCVLSHDNLSYVAHASLISHLQEQTMPTLIAFGQIGESASVILNIILPMLFVCHRRTSFTICITKPTSSVALGNSLRDAKPTLIAAPVPVLVDLAAELAAAPKSEGDAKLAAWAAKVSLDASKNRQDLADIAAIKGVGMAQQVNERIRATLGLDRCSHVLGLGPVPLAICEQLAQSGIDVLECYGTTECSGFASMSTPFHYRFGTSGIRLGGTDIKIDFNEGLPQRKEGEILVSGRNVMLGYIGNEQLTRRVLDKDGWLRTGDIGKVDEMNLLTVTGRVKELFTTLTGERISPAVIESELKRQCPVLSNVVVVGDRRKYVVALVTLKCKKNPETGAWTDDLAPEALHVNPDVLTVTTARRDKKWLDYIAQVVSVYNSQAPSPLHKVRRFCILSSDISTEEMTPTKKIKRQLVTDRCINIIEKLYAEDSPRSSTTK